MAKKKSKIKEIKEYVSKKKKQFEKYQAKKRKQYMSKQEKEIANLKQQRIKAEEMAKLRVAKLKERKALEKAKNMGYEKQKSSGDIFSFDMGSGSDDLGMGDLFGSTKKKKKGKDPFDLGF